MYNYIFMNVHNISLFKFYSYLCDYAFLPPSQGILPFVFSCECFLKFCLWFPLLILYLFEDFIYSNGFNYRFPKSSPPFFTYFGNIYSLILIAMDTSVWKACWCLKSHESKTQLIVSSFYMDFFPSTPISPIPLGNTKI